LTTLLGANGHQISSAPNGKVALKMINESTPDMIITDVLMPEMDGFELCRQVKANPGWKHALCVIYTGSYTTHLDEELGHAVGAVEYIIKPQEPEAFVKLIEKVIEDQKKI
jgi:CheY-like chemotaxis protein